MPYTRRDFGKVALAAIPFSSALANINSKFAGVQIGTISYSFRETNDLDAVIRKTAQCGLGEMELMSNHAESFAGVPTPAPAAASPAASVQAPPRIPRPPMTREQIATARRQNEAVRKWRLSVSMDKFKEVRSKFDTAGHRSPAPLLQYG